MESDIVRGPLRDFSETVMSAGLADSWFFIRYADPDPHLRIRFHGDPERLTGTLFGQLCAWAGGLIEDGICLKYAFDTYDQEIERFGGDAGIEVAESVFAGDSKAVVHILETTARTGCTFDQITLLALTVDDLLASLGCNQSERLRWYQIQTTAGGQEIGNEYRQRKKTLRTLLGDDSWLITQRGGPELAEILADRRKPLAVAGEELRNLESDGTLSRSLDVLYSSFVHLHINRMGGMGTRLEQNLLSLLLRTREGLKKAPVAGSK